MATKRTVELELKIQGATTLDEMESNLAAINAELQEVDVNSQAFEDLSKAAQQANNVLDKTNEKLEEITSQQKAESAVKLTEGLVGGFQAAAAASAIFGDETSQAIQDATNKAASLFLAMDGLKKVTEAFSADNIKGYKAIVKGIRQSTIATKLFGTTTKAALTATGIGILILAIGALAANWDKVTTAVGDFIDSIPFLKPIVEFFEDLEETIGSVGNLLSAVGAGIVGFFTSGTSASEAFNKSIEDGKKLLAIEKFAKSVERLSEGYDILFDEYNKQLAEVNAKHEANIKLIEEELALNDDVEKGKEIQLKLDKELLQQQEERSEIAQRFIDNDLFGLVDLREQLEIQRENALLTKANNKEQEKGREQWLKDTEEINRIEEEILNLDEIDKIVNDEIAAAIFQRLLLEKKILDEKKAQAKLADEKAEKERLKQLRLEITIQQNIFNQFVKEAEARAKERKERAKAEQEYQKQLRKRFADEAKARGDSHQAFIQSIIDQSNVIALLRIANELRREGNEESTLFIDEFQERATDILNNIADVSTLAFDAALQFVQNNLDKVESEVSKELKRIGKLQDANVKRQERLQAQLADANGQRHKVILGQLEAEKVIGDQLAADKLAQEEKLAKAKTAQAKLEKAQAIVQSIISTALAVVQALPLIPLSIIVGALGLAGTAAIAAQPIPEFDEGGYTAEARSDSTPVGVVHANEYVVPADVLSSSRGAEMVSILEGMRANQRGFQEGGFTPANIPEEAADSAATLNIDEVISAIESAQIFVSVQEIRDTQTNVEVIESKASL